MFITIIDHKMTSATDLCNLLLGKMISDRKRIIKIFTSILELNTKKQYLEDFHNSDSRIQTCMDATRMRVDIRNIVNVV